MKLMCAAVLAMAAVSGQAMSADPVCNIVEGSSIVAQDSRSTYLGNISSRSDKDSVFNEFGTYGNQLKGTSIWNEFAPFGSNWNLYSPFNPTSVAPPALVKSGRVIGYLTANTTIDKSITPNQLKKLCQNYF